jgi:hypothetical protein
VAYLALFAALATGGAYAADKIGSSDIKKNAVKSKHIKSGQVKTRDLAERAGFRAVAAVSTNPVGFNNSLVPERGFDGVRRDETGVYCLDPSPSSRLNPANDPPIITFEYAYSIGEDFTAMWDTDTSDCAAGEYVIKLYEAGTNTLSDNPEFVILIP